MKEREAHQELLLRYLDGNLRPAEEAQVADLLRSDPRARAFLRGVAQHAVVVADIERVDQGRQAELIKSHRPRGEPHTRFVERNAARVKWRLAIATSAIVALVVGVYVLRPSGETKIATITGLSGPLQWTGNGGRVFHGLTVGTELSGGTIDGMSPDSWFQLEFNDGSTVMISGNSMLTISDHGQKELHLKAGSFSATVAPQPDRKPMLIHTRSAMLEVLGTQFDVETGLSSTVLNVSVGTVRVKRLSDGDTVNVPANHRVIAAPDRELSPVRVPDSVHRWMCQLHRGPNRTYGEWSTATEGQYATLKAIPYTTVQGKTIYTAALRVSSFDTPPVLLKSESRVRIRGQITSAHEVYVGLTVRHPNGEFAGRFQTIRPAEEFQSGQEFEVVLPLRDYQLDPSLFEMKNKLPSTPFGLIVESIWCHTLHDQAGLAITEVELIAPEEDGRVP